MERRQFVGCAGLASMTALAGRAVAQDAETPPKGVKITVLKRTAQKDFAAYRDSEIKPCPLFEDGQEFVLESPWSVPEKFCDWAWADIRTYIHAVRGGGMDKAITCCTDGYRPVFFKVERTS
jgi:uncharacterized repeat protein (TIGR04076 family)